MTISEMKVLVCDDSILVRKRFRDLLAKNGCRSVLEASDGEESVRMYLEQAPDMVFMDIIMPKKNGLQALKEIRSHDPCARVVMASSVGTQSHLKEAINVGVYDFLQKPIEDERVLRIINKVISSL